MSMSRDLWYKMLGREDALDRSLFYRINEVEDPTKYELDLGPHKKFTFIKSQKRAKIGETELTLKELKRMFDFAKKNGAI